mmetsp:Transcript_13454/g.20312  ORF Transcript_13454/g.20312 Transcript_13454/m.20312 type:complete len:80 (-) Transcript_13454:26-265(-)
MISSKASLDGKHKDETGESFILSFIYLYIYAGKADKMFVVILFVCFWDVIAYDNIDCIFCVTIYIALLVLFYMFQCAYC